MTTEDVKMVRGENKTSNEEWISTKVAAGLNGEDVRTVRRKINKRIYESKKDIVKGQKDSYMVKVSKLSIEAQRKYQLKQNINSSLIPDLITDLFRKDEIQKSEVDTSKIIREAINEKDEKRKSAKFNIAKQANDSIINLKHGEKLTAQIKFLKLYNTGVYLTDEFAVVGNIKKFETIQNWINLLKENNWDDRVLLRKKKIVKTLKITTADLGEFIVIKALPNNFSVKESVDLAWEMKENKSPNITYSYHHYYKRCREFYKNNPDLFHATEKGERSLKNNFTPGVNIDKSKLKVGDKILFDGKQSQTKVKNGTRYIYLLARDEASGALCAGVVTKSETREATKTLFFRLIMFLGKKPLVVTPDNGPGFREKYIKEIAENLEIEYRLAEVGNPTGKAGLESANKDYKMYEKLLPGHIGGSIKTPLAYLNKYEKEAQDRYANIYGENELTHDDLKKALNKSMEMYNNRVIKTGINKGKKRIDVFNAGKGKGVNDFYLSYLMMIKRKIKATKNGIKIEGIRYYHPYFYKNQKYYIVRYDLVFNDGVYVFDINSGKFLFVAKKVEGCDPIGLVFGDEETARPILEQIRLKKTLTRMTFNSLKEIDEKYSKPVAEYLFEKVGYTKVEKNRARKENITRLKINDAEIVDEVENKFLLKTGTDNIVLESIEDKPANKKKVVNRIDQIINQRLNRK